MQGRKGRSPPSPPSHPLSPPDADRAAIAARLSSLRLSAELDAAVAAAPSPGGAPAGSPGRGDAARRACPPHGAKAICGRRPRMEDAYTAVPFLLEVPVVPHGGGDVLPPRVAAHVRSTPTSPTASGGDRSTSTTDDAAAGTTTALTRPPPLAHAASVGRAPFMETLHFFGVFDGHGGAEAALHCAQTLHRHIADALSAAGTRERRRRGGRGDGDGGNGDAAGDDDDAAGSSASGGSEDGAGGGTNAPPPPRTPAAVGAAVGAHARPLLPLAADGTGSGDLAAAAAAAAAAAESDAESDAESAALFDELARRLDGGAGGAPSPPARAPPSTDSSDANGDPAPYSTAAFETALHDAFTRTDAEFAEADGDAASLVGTTAVVALVGTRKLYVANCGDSRAVLCRGGAALPLTDDHKAAREDETARVEAAGGQILFWNGVRVMGVLAVSRAIGDRGLRPFVIAAPEVTIVGRRPDDELLLLASDGLWDVLSNSEAVTLARRCLARARARGATRASAARIAATVLTRAAVDRGSRDNVTVVVVDLSDDGGDGDAVAPATGDAAAAPTATPAAAADDPTPPAYSVTAAAAE